MSELAILRPYNPAEAIGTRAAAVIAGRSECTIRIWCSQYMIGRRIAGRWQVSRAALAMLLEGDTQALDAYLEGDRMSSMVTRYFAETYIAEVGVS